MTNEQYESYKSMDIYFVQRQHKAVGKISMQMNIITERDGEITFTPIAGLAYLDRDVFYDVAAPAMLRLAELKGTIVYLSVMFEAWLRIGELVDGKPDLKTIKDKPAKDCIVISFETKDITELAVFEVMPDKSLKRMVTDADKFEGMMPTILKKYVRSKQARHN